MLRTLFTVSNLAMLAWFPLWFLPRWRFTRWLAEHTVAPFFVALLWLVGAVPLFARLGLLNVLGGFGSADGVLHLFTVPDFALLIWVQILAWDLFVGIYIYRDNMAGGYLPLWLQSVVLIVTFWVGPVGYILYYLLRAWRRRVVQGQAAAGARAAAAPEPAPPAVLFWGERVLVWVGLLGLAVAGAMLLLLAVRGRYIAPEGDLIKPLTFCLAVGLYALSIAAFLPIAGFTARGRRTFRWTLAATALYAYFAEAGPTLAGFDPRFSHANRGLWAWVGAFFGLSTVALVSLILVFAWRVFRWRTAPPRPLVVLGLRYAMLASVLAAAGGIWMIAIQSRFTGPAGNILFMHALGFHGIQAVPLLAWLLEQSKPPATARTWVHVGGAAYLGATLLLLLQTIAGRGLFDLTAASLGYILLLLTWAVLTALAAANWRRGQVPQVPLPAGGDRLA